MFHVQYMMGMDPVTERAALQGTELLLKNFPENI